MELTAAYTQNEQYTEARSTMYSLDNVQYYNYIKVQDVLIDLKEQSLKLTELMNDQLTLADLDVMTGDTLTPGYIEARGVLELLNQDLHYPEYFDPIPVAITARLARCPYCNYALC
ncbi:MAG: hypothetical protein JKY53_06650 [Flavobacteriales bacterium]|nr:hypothetical protein [Flavobacteriales bacterium]